MRNFQIVIHDRTYEITQHDDGTFEMPPELASMKGRNVALKPAHEPIIVARKPITGTVAANVLAYGTGALNIDATRIQTTDRLGGGAEKETTREQKGDEGWTRPWMDDPGAREAHATRVRANVQDAEAKGRWPANVVLDESQAGELDAQTGILTSGKMRAGTRPKGERNTYGQDAQSGYGTERDTPGDSGGASRFFKVADADDPPSGRWPTNVAMDDSQAAELDAQNATTKSTGGRTANISTTSTIYGGGHGLGQALDPGDVRGDPGYGDVGGPSRFFPTFKYQAKASKSERPKIDGVSHPTVKPLALMRWLVRLVTPPDGLVFDPFLGSGTTAQACLLEGFRCYGIENNAQYMALTHERLRGM